MVLPENAVLTPILLEEELSSLSAILLDDDYYQFLRNEPVILDGVSILNTPYLIPFKMKAWLDLTERRELGEKIDSRDNMYRTLNSNLISINLDININI